MRPNITVKMATAAGASCGIDPPEPASDNFFSVVPSFLFSDVSSDPELLFSLNKALNTFSAIL